MEVVFVRSFFNLEANLYSNVTRKGEIKLIIFRMILCVCLFVIGIGAGGKAILNLIYGGKVYKPFLI